MVFTIMLKDSLRYPASPGSVIQRPIPQHDGPIAGASLRTNTRLHLTVFSLGLSSLMLVSTLLGARLTIR